MKKIPVRQRQFVISFVVPNATLKTHLYAAFGTIVMNLCLMVFRTIVLRLVAVRTIMLRRLPVVISSLEFEFDVVKRYSRAVRVENLWSFLNNYTSRRNNF
jgi:hypothetical protein